jgi:nucleoid-associated protein YgaU
MSVATEYVLALHLAEPAREPAVRLAPQPAPQRATHLATHLATNLAPQPLPRPVRSPSGDRPVGGLATVTRLYPPHPASLRAPVRLTPRGLAALASAVVALAAVLVLAAWRSAPPAASAGPTTQGPATVVVHAGDSLWSIAARIAPGSDPRAVVAQLQQLNHMSAPVLRPGQLLRTR